MIVQPSSHTSLRTLPFDVEAIAAAVMCRNGDIFHAGLFYRIGSGHGALNLGWENQLHNHWDADRSVWVTPQVEPETLQAVATWCRKIWREFEKTKKFPYGLGLDAQFDAQGNLERRGLSRGMTCATLILAVFKTAGFSLVDEATWEIRTEEDQTWLAKLRAVTGSHHLTTLEAEIEAGLKRVRPEEVIGACMQPQLPASFEMAWAGGQEAIQVLVDSR